MTDPDANPTKPSIGQSPKPKTYVRSRTTGDLGYLIEVDGVTKVRLDRPAQNIDKVYSDADWAPEESPRRLTIQQIGRIAFEADKAFCLHLGMPNEAKRDWTKLKPAQHQQWAETGPPGPERQELFQMTMGTLLKYTR
jgi:hypothetical protein